MQVKTSKNVLSNNNTRRLRVLAAGLLVPALTACPVNSTGVNDSDLIAQILVQNDNGQSRATVKFSFSDVTGRNKVDLVADESISYTRNGSGDELAQTGDGEYSISLPSATPGWYTFTLVRESEDRELIQREISNNFVYLPNSFDSVQAASVQSGPDVSISWIADEEIPYMINDFSTTGSDDSFNAIASCVSAGNAFDVVVTDALINTQDGISTLDIPVESHLRQVLNMTTEEIAAASCEFDVQLVRTIIGDTDIALDRRSTATGQVLNNIVIQWSGQ